MRSYTLDENEEHDLHRLLGAMLLPLVPMQEKEEIIASEFDIELAGKGKELIGTMCNLGEGIKEEAPEYNIDQIYEYIRGRV